MKKAHKNQFFLPLALFCSLMVLMLLSCNTFKNTSKPEYATDAVCNMKVDKAHAYSYKYKGVEYFFDTKDCKAAFKMNPEKFIKQ
jgi:YHS domain-containing protein